MEDYKYIKTKNKDLEIVDASYSNAHNDIHIIWCTKSYNLSVVILAGKCNKNVWLRIDNWF